MGEELYPFARKTIDNVSANRILDRSQLVLAGFSCISNNSPIWHSVPTSQ